MHTYVKYRQDMQMHRTNAHAKCRPLLIIPTPKLIIPTPKLIIPTPSLNQSDPTHHHTPFNTYTISFTHNTHPLTTNNINSHNCHLCQSYANLCTAVPTPQFDPLYRLTQINPFSPKSLPQLFFTIQQVALQPTIYTAWFICALAAHLNTPNAYFYQPVALTAATIGPSCSIPIIVLSSAWYFDTLVLFEMTSRSVVEHSPQLLEQGSQGKVLSKGSPLFRALSIAFQRQPPEQLLPGVHFSRYCSDRSTWQILVFIALPCRIRELSHIATVAKDQQVPQLPCALTGVTAPRYLQSSESETESLILMSWAVLVSKDGCCVYFCCYSTSSLQFYGKNSDLPSVLYWDYVLFLAESRRSIL